MQGLGRVGGGGGGGSGRVTTHFGRVQEVRRTRVSDLGFEVSGLGFRGQYHVGLQRLTKRSSYAAVCRSRRIAPAL